MLSSTEDLGDRTWLVAACLIGFGLLLGVADRRPGDRDVGSLRVRDALLLGVAQGLAFQPGVSRSGVVLTVARGMGVAGTAAATVSGWFAVHGMLRLLASRGMGGFVAYRVLAGLAVLLVLAVR